MPPALASPRARALPDAMRAARAPPPTHLASRQPPRKMEAAPGTRGSRGERARASAARGETRGRGGHRRAPVGPRVRAPAVYGGGNHRCGACAAADGAPCDAAAATTRRAPCLSMPRGTCSAAKWRWEGHRRSSVITRRARRNVGSRKLDEISTARRLRGFSVGDAAGECRAAAVATTHHRRARSRRAPPPGAARVAMAMEETRTSARASSSPSDVPRPPISASDSALSMTKRPKSRTSWSARLTATPRAHTSSPPFRRRSDATGHAERCAEPRRARESRGGFPRDERSLDARGSVRGRRRLAAPGGRVRQVFPVLQRPGVGEGAPRRG